MFLGCRKGVCQPAWALAAPAGIRVSWPLSCHAASPVWTALPAVGISLAPLFIGAKAVCHAGRGTVNVWRAP
jgi:hypothetical protein